MSNCEKWVYVVIRQSGDWDSIRRDPVGAWATRGAASSDRRLRKAIEPSPDVVFSVEKVPFFGRALP